VFTECRVTEKPCPHRLIRVLGGTRRLAFDSCREPLPGPADCTLLPATSGVRDEWDQGFE
jgi:hypothetical protein